mmetsp:Transcript_71161/g.126718  ORF Transcript_71161/g.126718 Transcript_71161/m.126718 type:complete len:91 (-) Transcript_71161:1308-1580(-)
MDARAAGRTAGQGQPECLRVPGAQVGWSRRAATATQPAVLGASPDLCRESREKTEPDGTVTAKQACLGRGPDPDIFVHFLPSEDPGDADF